MKSQQKDQKLISICNTVSKYYNGKQSTYLARFIENGNKVDICYNKNNNIIHEVVGFYQFIFSPKYKVFEVFKVTYYDFLDMDESTHELEIVKIKQPEEILKYLGGSDE
jgi:hypothetical protein